MKPILTLAFAIALAVLAAFAARAVGERDRQVDELEALGSALEQARAAVDSCGAALALERDEFLRFDQRVDSLRAITDGYVDLEQGGVPEAQYHDYLVTFETYNDSVDAWQPRADSLRAREARCRALIEYYNELGDSIQKRREEITGGSE
jgi:hypothetical protein